MLQILDDLVIAVDSEAQMIDISRVSTFMTRVGAHVSLPSFYSLTEQYLS